MTTMSDGRQTSPIRRRLIPWALEKRTGCFVISMMSACFVIAQNGSYSGGVRYTGHCARSRVQTWCG